ncbi:MAG: glycoside hydrolase family 2 protein [Chloroflexota bacterium]
MMIQQFLLNGEWQLSGGEIDLIPAQVPGNVHTALLQAGLIADPYYRDQEVVAFWVGETDWTFERPFTIPHDLLKSDKLLLKCHGLDTLATIWINGRELAQTDNMFRIYEFDLKPFVNEGKNDIKIQFKAPATYAMQRLRERYLHNWGVEKDPKRAGEFISHHKLPGGNYLRKEQCNFGWDWGPKVPTAGIWQDIEIVAFNNARIDDIYIRQVHKEGVVDLSVDLNVEKITAGNLKAQLTVIFDDQPVATAEQTVDEKLTQFHLTIEKPNLWWPNGLGEQPLYTVLVQLRDAQNQALDQTSCRIGLRTLRLVRQPDEWGESFHFEANGVPFFSKGANWIPAESFLDWLTADDYERLIQDSALVNMNMLRVWGGGIYEPDLFYDLCDEYGICVWQDFMFGCATYPTFDDEWMATFEQEAIGQIQRLRHHASLALWCGNNELEQGLVAPEETETTMSWAEYGRLFDQLLPKLVQQLDPQTDYWPSSPHTPIGDRHNFNDPTSGDAHIWNVWHGLEPFEFYRTCLHRFNSEFGFQSFPEPKTVYAYTEPQDRNITTYVMEHHQRSDNGNSRIMHYMLDWFRLPTSFENTLWLSQIQQGMAIKYAVEHWRRTMPRGMGTLYWQLNDCWPVASWASIDYYGRWKALHYMARHFFAPVLISGLEDWDSGDVEIHLTNDQIVEQTGEVVWQLLTTAGAVLENGRFPTTISPISSSQVLTLNFKEAIAAHTARQLMVHLSFEQDDQILSDNLVLFCRPKHLELAVPSIHAVYEADEDGFIEVTITTDTTAIWVWLHSEQLDIRLSDNFFHLLPGQSKVITIVVDEEIGLEEVKTAVPIQSLVDTFA